MKPAKLIPLLLLAGCSTAHDYHAVQTRIATCDVMTPDQIEALDVRTGSVLLSTPHRYTCFRDVNGRIVWRVENEAEASLEGIVDNPISSAIKNGIPSATVNY